MVVFDRVVTVEAQFRPLTTCLRRKTNARRFSKSLKTGLCTTISSSFYGHWSSFVSILGCLNWASTLQIIAQYNLKTTNTIDCTTSLKILLSGTDYTKHMFQVATVCYNFARCFSSGRLEW